MFFDGYQEGRREFTIVNNFAPDSESVSGWQPDGNGAPYDSDDAGSWTRFISFITVVFAQVNN